MCECSEKTVLQLTGFAAPNTRFVCNVLFFSHTLSAPQLMSGLERFHCTELCHC